MPPKKKKEKKGKTASAEGEKTPEMILADFTREYKKICGDMKVDTMSTALDQVKKHLELADGAQVFTKLIFSDTASPDALSALLLALETYEPIRALHFWRTRLGDDGVHVITEFLKTDSKVRILELTDCRISPRGCVFLASCLGSGSRVNASLLRLELDFNPLGDEGIITLCRALRINEAKIEHLTLRFCGIGALGGCAIGEDLLASLKSLKSLDLQGNELGADGVIGVSAGLPRAENLKSLSLKETSFGRSHDAVQSLCSALSMNRSIDTLDLNQNFFSDEDSKLLMETLQKKEKGFLKSVVVSERLPTDVYKAISELCGTSDKKKGAKKGGKKKKKE